MIVPERAVLFAYVRTEGEGRGREAPCPVHIQQRETEAGTCGLPVVHYILAAHKHFLYRKQFFH